jgi:hypothetical protein
MTDSPGDFQAVNLEVTEVAVQHAGGAGWEVIQSGARTYDLLQLRNGVFSTLGSSQLPAGAYSRLRLMLGSQSNVVVDNTTYPLPIPSALQNGLELPGSFNVPIRGRVDVALDFDVARSIIPTGGGYALDPTIRVVNTSLPGAGPGAVHGVVGSEGQILSALATVSAISNDATVASTLNAADGQFRIVLLPAGTYRLVIHAQGYQDHIVDGVVVDTDATTEVGTFSLQPILTSAR